MNKVLKKKGLFVLFIAAFISILFILKIFTINGYCGFKYGHMAKTQGRIGKEWECQCIGIKGEKITSYTEEYTCTGINLSGNRLIPLLNRNRQYPLISL